MYTQSMTGIAQQVYGLKQIEKQNRFENIQLHLSGLRSLRNCYIVTEYLKADLIAYLRNDGIYLTRHNAASRLPCRQNDFRKSRFGTAGHQTKIIAHL